MAIGPLKILEMVSSQNERITGNWVVFSSCDSVGAPIYREPAEQREKGELKPLELQNAEEFIIREVQSKVYSAEIEPLTMNKEIQGGSTLASFNPV